MIDARTARRLWAALRAGIRGVRATPWVFAISVGTMSAGLLLLAAYLLVVHNMRGALERFGSELRLAAYLRADAARADTEAALRALDGVVNVTWISPEQALERLRADLGNDADVLEGLPRNPLPASFEIDVAPAERTPERLQALAARMRAVPGVDEVRWGEEWAAGYARVLGAAEWIGLGLGAFLLLALGAIVAGTVRLAVLARADEIEIQRLVGAGGLFVRLPFYLEGALQGGVAAGVALGTLFALYRLGLPWVQSSLAVLLGRSQLAFFGPLEIAGILAVAVALGAAGAIASLVTLEERA